VESPWRLRNARRCAADAKLDFPDLPAAGHWTWPSWSRAIGLARRGFQRQGLLEQRDARRIAGAAQDLGLADEDVGDDCALAGRPRQLEGASRTPDQRTKARPNTRTWP
jgi:hypothetical protein